MTSTATRTVSVPFERIAGWIDRYGQRHPGTSWHIAADRVVATADDGSGCTFEIPFGGLDPDSLLDAASPAGASSPAADVGGLDPDSLVDAASPAGASSPAADVDGLDPDSLVDAASPAGASSPADDVDSLDPDSLVDAASPAGASSPAADDDSLDRLLAHLALDWPTAVLLVRRGGFAVAHLRGGQVMASKIGQRHVQGRTKAGGWSQQRFARRRDNQARDAFQAAAGHLAELVVPAAADLVLLGVGGDRAAVGAVLDEPTSRPLAEVPRRWLGAYPDPKRATLEAAIVELRSITITLTDP